MARDQVGNRPPCFVLGLDTQIGASVIRELGRAGIRVIGLASDEQSIGLRSNYLQRGVVVGKARDDEFARRIRALGEEYGGAIMLAISEGDIAWLILHRNNLGRVKVVAPDAEAFRRVVNKAATLEVATRLGIRAPKTLTARCLDDWREACKVVRYPVVVKWAEPISARRELQAHGLGMEKLDYALDASSLNKIGERFAPAKIWPLIQEYCPGRGLGQFFFMHDGKAIRRFQHIRIAEWPPEGGFSSVCEVVPNSHHRELQEQSIALLQAIGWEGCAMVEYRLDEASGEAALMEINGRFWGSFPLAVHAGAGFATLAYHVQGLGIIPSLPPPIESLRCRMISTELKRLVRIILQRRKIRDPFFKARPAYEVWRFISEFFRPNTRYCLWDARDPGPSFADLRNYLSRLTTKTA